jgi:hypothetical protein
MSMLSGKKLTSPPDVTAFFETVLMGNVMNHPQMQEGMQLAQQEMVFMNPSIKIRCTHTLLFL